MSIEILLEELYSYSNSGIKLGLKNIEVICNAMGNPQNNFKTIHIGGTNGKGSTSATIETVLIEAGLNVGKFTSPHILKFNERITFNGIEITDTDVEFYFNYIKKIIKKLNIFPTFFEIITAMMFKYFSDKNINYAILEVGLGGRFDSTNIVNGDICVITNVSLDHTEILGDSIYDIACEKAEIIKPNSKVIVGSLEKEFLKAIENKTKNYINVCEKYKNAKYNLDFKNFRTIIELDNDNYEFSLFGDYQYKNFLCAFEVLKELGIPSNIIKKGAKKVKWQCRFEIILNEKNIIILDGAHNISGITSLCETLIKGLKKEEIVAVVSILKDKKTKEIIDILEKNVSTIIFTSLLENPRGQSALELYNSSNKIDKFWCDNIDEAFNLAKNQHRKIILFCGSFYLLSKFKKEILYYEKNL